MTENLLDIENLRVYFHTSEGVVPAVDDVSFSVPRGKTIGIVGESGCGKSVMSLSILQLLTARTAKIEEGSSIRLNDRELLDLPKKELRKIRGNQVSMIFQDSMTSLNPIMSIGKQMAEPFILHQGMTKSQAREASLALLKKVGISEPQKRLRQFPHEFSGGMRQRIMIAMALSCKPQLLIADEPTTALDVTTQAQIMALMKNLKENIDTSILLITHDMGVVADMADEILVMYTGKVVEKADKRSIFKDPLHPYTQGLLSSIPNIFEEAESLTSIKGAVPNLLHMPKGCSFCDRCPFAKEICRKKKPELYQVGERQVRCFRYCPGAWEGEENG